MPANLRIRRELRGGLALAAFGVAFLGYGARYPLDTLSTPGPGLFPLGAGVLVLALAAWQVVHAARTLLAGGAAKAQPAEPEAREGSFRQEEEWKPILLVAILVAYLLVVSGVGFLVSTAIVVIACSRLMGTSGWRIPLLLALGAALSCYFLFEVWLKVPLPRGYLI